MQVYNLSTFENVFLSVLSAKINTVYITNFPKTIQYIKIIQQTNKIENQHKQIKTSQGDLHSVSHWHSDVACLPWCTVPARWWSQGQWLWPQPGGLRWCRQPGWPGWCWTGACALCAGCRQCCRPPAAPPAGHSGHTHLYRNREKDINGKKHWRHWALIQSENWDGCLLKSDDDGGQTWLIKIRGSIYPRAILFLQWSIWLSIFEFQWINKQTWWTLWHTGFWFQSMANCCTQRNGSKLNAATGHCIRV